jgi:hypothetical protein
MVGFSKSLFFSPSNKRLANVISIKNPYAFKRSISTLNKGGLNLSEKRALNLAKTRATLQLRRKDLSYNERKQFSRISKMKIPKARRK